MKGRGGVGATVGGQINKGGGVKKVGHCTDTVKEQGVKKKGGGVRKIRGGGQKNKGGGSEKKGGGGG